MPRVPAALAVLMLSGNLLPVAAAQGSPEPSCVDYSSYKICTQLNPNALKGPGRSTKWRIWVEGGGNPIQIRLHNNSPKGVRLKGGNDQIVHMGCRWHREVRRRITAIGVGEARLEARPYSPSPKRESATIAAELAPLLKSIEAKFIERRDKLPPDYPALALEEWIDSTEAELLNALSYQELAPLRDYVQEKFRQARYELNARTMNGRNSFQSVSAPRFMFASFSAAGPARLSFLDQIVETLHRLYEIASRSDLIVNLCVTSEPEDGARFWMRPQSYRIRRETGTNGEIRGLYRGLYVYSMRKGLRKGVECLNLANCGGINLVDDSSPIFQGDLRAKTYRRLPGPLPAGVCLGN